MEHLLLHTCCAPCSVYCVSSLREEGIEPVSFWFNPNIHPYQEYGLRTFVEAVGGDLDHRCGYCYTCRLEETARYAAEHGFTAFSTTLLVSPYQDHEGICRAARQLAERYGVPFLYRDFRPGFRRGQAEARERGLYMQKYCGCVFSEEERYAKQIKRDQEKSI